MTFNKGDTVWICLGEQWFRGTVNYVRVEGSTIVAYSIIRDDKASQLGYAGTIVGADKVFANLPG